MRAQLQNGPIVVAFSDIIGNLLYNLKELPASSQVGRWFCGNDAGENPVMLVFHQTLGVSHWVR